MATHATLKLSDYIAQQRSKVSTLLLRYGLTANQIKEASSFQRCPINADHIIPIDAYEKHVRWCRRAHNPYFKEPPPDPSFAYAHLANIVSIPKSGKGNYVPIINDKCEDNQSTLQTLKVDTPFAASVPPISLAKDPSNADDEDDVYYEEPISKPQRPLVDENVHLDQNTTPYAEQKRLIKQWICIPASHSTLSSQVIPPKPRVLAWLVENVERFAEGVFDVELMEFIYDILCEVETASPFFVAEQLQDFFGAKTFSFVLALWKYIWLTDLESRKEHLNQIIQKPNTSENDLESAATPFNHPPPLPPNPPPDQRNLLGNRQMEDKKPIISMEGASLIPEVRRKLQQYVDDISYAEFMRSSNGLPDMSAFLRADNFRYVGNRKDGNQPKTKEELLAEERDYKRRRQSYRAKNVHLTKRTPTQVFRDIIEMRMQEILDELSDLQESTIKSANADTQEPVIRVNMHMKQSETQKSSQPLPPIAAHETSNRSNTFEDDTRPTLVDLADGKISKIDLHPTPTNAPSNDDKELKGSISTHDTRQAIATKQHEREDDHENRQSRRGDRDESTREEQSRQKNKHRRDEGKSEREDERGKDDGSRKKRHHKDEKTDKKTKRSHRSGRRHESSTSDSNSSSDDRDGVQKRESKKRHRRDHSPRRKHDDRRAHRSHHDQRDSRKKEMDSLERWEHSEYYAHNQSE